MSSRAVVPPAATTTTTTTSSTATPTTSITAPHSKTSSTKILYRRRKSSCNSSSNSNSSCNNLQHHHQKISNCGSIISTSSTTPTTTPEITTPTPSTTISSSNTNNNYHNSNSSGYSSFFSPIHQRIIEWEDRLRRWKLFSGRRHQRRSASSDPKLTTTPRHNLLSSRASPKRPSNFAGSLTCPVPRKIMDFNFSGPRRQVYETDRPESEEELERIFEEIKARSGVIEIGPQIYRDVKIENLSIRAELGSGTCGSVTQRVLDNRLLAVKEMKKTDNSQETKRILRDLQVICKSNDCQYIVRSYGYILTYDHVYICMETMAMCLEKLYKNHLMSKGLFIPECILGKVAVSVIQALKYLKDTHNIIHRDIKPSNILIDWNGYIKLCDFGIAGQLIDSLASTSSLGCTAYLSPERIKRDKYDIRADVWSLGITLIELAMSQYPYIFQNPFDLMCCITDQPTPRLPDSFSTDFRFFVDKCLEKKAISRPKYDNLVEFDWYKTHRDMVLDVGEWLSAVLVEDDD